MAFRTWAKLLGATLGVAALAAASQLGVAYGLGILRLTRVLDEPTRDQWTAQLAWVAWFAMMAAVLGGLAGGWLLERWRGSVTIATHIALSLAAGAGAALVVPLTMQPARTAQIAGVHPVFVIGLCAGLGALVGVFAAYAALTQLVARWSLSIFGLVIWVIAIIAVIAAAPLLPAVRLGVFDAGFAPSVTQRTALFTMPALALLVGAMLGWAARRREMPTLTIALAGLPGPALLTLSYLIAGPGSGNDRYQVVPYWAAMTATGAGVLGSVLAAVLRKGEEAEGTGDTAADDEQKTEAIGLPSPAAHSTTPPTPASRISARHPEQSTSARTAPDRPAADQATSEWPAAGRRRGRTPRDPAADPGRPPADRSFPDRPAQSGPGPLASPPGDPRSRVADAIGSRTAEWPHPTPPGRAKPLDRSAPPDQPGTGSVALGEYTQQEPAPFDAFAPASGRRGNSSRQHAAPEPYVPAPAIPPMPPGRHPGTPRPARPPGAGSARPATRFAVTARPGAEVVRAEPGRATCASAARSHRRPRRGRRAATGLAAAAARCPPAGPSRAPLAPEPHGGLRAPPPAGPDHPAAHRDPGAAAAGRGHPA